MLTAVPAFYIPILEEPYMGRGETQTAESLSSEYEILFCIRDMLEIYGRQLTGLYGKIPKEIEKTKSDIEKRIRDIENRLDCGL